MSLELVEKSLSRIEREVREVRRTQLLIVKTLVRLWFNDNIPFELTSLMAELKKKVKSLEKDQTFPYEKALKEA